MQYIMYGMYVYTLNNGILCCNDRYWYRMDKKEDYSPLCCILCRAERRVRALSVSLSLPARPARTGTGQRVLSANQLVSLCKIIQLSKPCHVGIHWKVLAKYYQTSTNMPGFASFFNFFLK